MRAECRSLWTSLFRRLSVARGMLIGAVLLGGCAATDFSTNDCTQLGGTYSNHGTPDDRLLTDILFKESAKGALVGVVTFEPRGDGRLIVTAARSRTRELHPERDFHCTSAGLLLVQDEETSLALPGILAVATVTEYTLSKTVYGDLQASAVTRGSAHMLGLPIPGRSGKKTIEWKRVKPGS